MTALRIAGIDPDEKPKRRRRLKRWKKTATPYSLAVEAHAEQMADAGFGSPIILGRVAAIIERGRLTVAIPGAILPAGSPIPDFNRRYFGGVSAVGPDDED